MEYITAIKDRIPDYAKDIRLNLDAVLARSSLDRTSFELYALAASIVGKCEFCVRSHYSLLRENGMSTQQLRDVGRIAAVVDAAAQVFVAESEAVAA